MSLTLAVTFGDKSATAADGSTLPTLEVPEDSKVTFTLTSTDVISAPEIERKENGEKITVFTPAADNLSATAEFTVTKTSFGLFAGSATINGAQQKADNAVMITLADSSPEGGTNDGGPAVNELQVGELDRPFLYITLGFVALLSLAVAAAVWNVIGRVELPEAEAIETGKAIVGTWGERVASVVLMIGLGAGIIVMFIGAWLGAIETRGRLRANLSKDPNKGFSATSDELKAIAEILDKARRLRGSIVVVLSGAFIAAISIWGVNAMAGDGATPAPTNSTTSTVKPTPIPTPTEGK